MVDAPTLELYFRSSDLYRDFSSVIGEERETDYTSASYRSPSKLNPIMEGANRDLNNSNSSTPSVSSKGVSHASTNSGLQTRLLPSGSMDMSLAESDIVMEDQSVGILEIIQANIKALRETNYRIVWLHSEVILSRSIFALFKRYKLVLGSLILHIFFAINFWWIMDDSSEDTNPVVGFFSVSGLVLIVANVQFGYYLFSTNEVPLFYYCWHILFYFTS